MSNKVGNYKLFPYQERAVEFIQANDRCALWLGCGLGKTAVTLSTIPSLPGPVLIIAPKAVVLHTWPKEVNKWLPSARVISVTGSPSERRVKMKQDADIYLINFELITWLVGEMHWPWKTVVIDESTRIKNRSSKLFKALRKVAGKWEKHIQLTGSPACNGLEDLWSQLYLIDRGERLGKTLTSFRNRWFKADYMGWNYEALPHAQGEIETRCKDKCLSMSTDDYLDLPSMMIDDITVELEASIKHKYNQLKRDLVAEIEGEPITAMTAGVLTNKLLQITSGTVYNEDRETVTVHSTKLEAIADIINTVGDEPVVISYQFRHELEQLRKCFKNGVELRDYDNAVELWNDGCIPVLFIHPASAGHGLNLQEGGRHLIWSTPPFNLEHYIQTNARLHRTGQTKPVMIYRILAADTIDQHVVTTLGKKDAVQTALLNALKPTERV